MSRPWAPPPPPPPPVADCHREGSRPRDTREARDARARAIVGALEAKFQDAEQHCRALRDAAALGLLPPPSPLTQEGLEAFSRSVRDHYKATLVPARPFWKREGRYVWTPDCTAAWWAAPWWALTWLLTLGRFGRLPWRWEAGTGWTWKEPGPGAPLTLEAAWSEFNGTPLPSWLREDGREEVSVLATPEMTGGAMLRQEVRGG